MLVYLFLGLLTGRSAASWERSRPTLFSSWRHDDTFKHPQFNTKLSTAASICSISEYLYLKLQRELVRRVFAHFFEVRVEVVQLHRTERTQEYSIIFNNTQCVRKYLLKYDNHYFTNHIHTIIMFRC